MKLEQCKRALKCVLIYHKADETLADYVRDVYREFQDCDPVLFAEACAEVSRKMTPFKRPLKMEYSEAYKRLREARRALDPTRNCQLCFGSGAHPTNRREVERNGVKYEIPEPCTCQETQRGKQDGTTPDQGAEVGQEDPA
jgi:hypothetical protein